MNFELDDKSKHFREKVRAFMEAHIYPIEKSYIDFFEENTDAVFPPMEQLKTLAQSSGLWNLFLPVEYGKYSGGLTNLQYAPIAQEMGKVTWASEVFNCNAPDTGNMEVLAKYGNDAHKEEWLEPLLEGRIRSAFLMTEPDVASSDARNIATSIRREGEEYVINGTKWWSTNANHPNCKIYIVMGKTDPDAHPYGQQSMILVPKDTHGVKTIRKLPVFNYHDPPGDHCEIELRDVRVPVSNMIAGEGRGFEIAQGRLGPGRIHHCMRLIGQAERALDYMAKRVMEREAFGRPLAAFSSIRQELAKSFCEIEQARLLTLSAADKIDKVGAKGAKDLIAAIKIVAPQMTCNVVDRAMQIFGGKGLSNDLPLAQMYSAARSLRLADGPDEVHMYQLGKQVIRNYMEKQKSETRYFDEEDKAL